MSCGLILKLNLYMYACYWATTYTRYISNNILSDLYVIWHQFIWFVHCDIQMFDMSCFIHSLVSSYILRLSYDLLNIITCNISYMGAYCLITNIIYYMFASNYLCIFVHDTTIDLYTHLTHIPTCHMYDKVQPTLSRTAFCAIST